jgi:hypothetical protein
MYNEYLVWGAECSVDLIVERGHQGNRNVTRLT